MMANTSDGIVACLYEYYVAYEPFFKDKVRYIPLPLNTSEIEFQPISDEPEKVNFLLVSTRYERSLKGLMLWNGHWLE
jgi:hypothetical protein